jgi:hypothetical protein
MSEELKPCPFCGSRAVTHESKYRGGNWLECENRECIGSSIVGVFSQWQHRPIEDALRAKLDMAVEAMRALLYAAEMRRNWDILSSDDFDEAYPDECSWAFGDVDENMIQKMEMAQKALEEKKRLK